MKQKELARQLQILLILAVIIVAFLAFVTVPGVAADLAASKAQYAYLRLPFEIYIWISLVPIAGIIMQGWRVIDAISKDNSFCMDNAARLKKVSHYCMIELVYYFCGLVALVFMELFSFKVIAALVVVQFLFLSLAAISAMMSHLVMKATELKDENDLTV